MNRSYPFKRGLSLLILMTVGSLLLGLSSPLLAEEPPVDGETGVVTEINEANLQEIDIQGIGYYDQARSLLEKINALRASLGIDPLVFNFELEDLAMLRAAETSIYWDHRRPNGHYINQDVTDIQAENIEGGIGDPQLVFDNWRLSQGHYDNMVNPEFKSIGIGAYGSLRGEAPRWWSQVFSGTLPENKLPERHDGTVISHRIQVDPTLLEMKVLTGNQINTGFAGNAFWQDAVLRLKVGSTVHLYGMLHYRLTDDYSRPGSLPPDSLLWENDNPEVATLDPDGNLTCLSEGTTRIRVKHQDLPELSAEMEIQVLPVVNFQLAARLSFDRSEEIRNEALALYQAKPSVEEYQGESTAEANREKEVNYRYYDSLNQDSELQQVAYELVKQYSLFLYSDSMESLPDINRISEQLPSRYRIAWHGYSDLDSPEDRTLQVPGWARSMAALVLESGGHQIYFLIYSNNPGDGQVLTYQDLVPPEEQGDPGQYEIAYRVSLFEDRADVDVNFVDQGMVVSQVDFADPQDPRLEQNEAGQFIYSLKLTAGRKTAGPYPSVYPAENSILYEVDQPELASFTGDGKLLIKGQGSFTIRADLVDVESLDVISSAYLLVNNYIPVPEVEPPIPEKTLAKESQQPEATGTDPN